MPGMEALYTEELQVYPPYATHWYMPSRLGRTPWDHPGYRINDNARSKFSAGKNIITDRDLFIAYLIYNSGINTFVMSADDAEMIIFRKLDDLLLIKDTSLGTT